jgi:hypothetical protein
MFALKTWLRRNDVMHPDGESESDKELVIKPSADEVAEG